MSTKRTKNSNSGKDKKETNCPECAFQSFTTFSTDSVVRLSTDAFSIHEKALIALEYTECFLVLFYTENSESKKLAKIWSVVAQQTPGPVFGGCNVLLESKVAKAFAKIRSHPSHPFKPYSLHGWPLILVYREGYPTAVYNGSREVQAIADWAMTLACSANYFEPEQIFGGIEAYNLLEEQKLTPYINEEGKTPIRRTSSSQYVSGKSIRGTNPNIPLVVEGSESDDKATRASREEEAEKMGYRLSPEQANLNLGTNPDLKNVKKLEKDISFNPGQPENNEESGKENNEESGKENNEESGKENNEESGEENNGESGEENNGENGKENNGENGKENNGENGKENNGENGKENIP
jgi:hypothetical protein